MCGGFLETSAWETVDHGSESLMGGWGERASDAWMESGMSKRGMSW